MRHCTLIPGDPYLERMMRWLVSIHPRVLVNNLKLVVSESSKRMKRRIVQKIHFFCLNLQGVVSSALTYSLLCIGSYTHKWRMFQRPENAVIEIYDVGYWWTDCRTCNIRYAFLSLQFQHMHILHVTSVFQSFLQRPAQVTHTNHQMHTRKQTSDRQCCSLLA